MCSKFSTILFPKIKIDEMVLKNASEKFISKKPQRGLSI
jgi:hypothetical protein